MLMLKIINVPATVNKEDKNLFIPHTIFTLIERKLRGNVV